MNNFKFYLILIFIFSVFRSPAQSFIHRYSDLAANQSSHPYSFDQAIDGNYFIAATGYNQSHSQQGLFIIKTDHSGDTIWCKLFQLTTYIPRTIAATPDSGFIVGGDEFILRADKNGNVIWQKLITGYSIVTIAKTSNGFILGGVDMPVSISGSCCFYILMMSASGNLYKSYKSSNTNGQGQQWLYDIKAISNGKFILSFSAYTHTSTVANALITDTTFNSGLLFQGIDGQEVRCFETTNHKFIFIYSSQQWGTTIAKLDSTGNQYWVKNFNTYFKPTFIDTIEKSGIIVCGKLQFNNEFVIHRIDSDGIILNSFRTCCIDSPVVRSGGTNRFSFVSLDSTNVGKILLHSFDNGSICLPQFTDSLVTSNSSISFWSGTSNLTLDLINTSTLSGNISRGGQSDVVCVSTNINPVNKEISLEIYPNPVTNRLTIFSENIFQSATLRIFNPANELVFSTDIFNKTTELDISYLNPGTYFIQFVTKNQVEYQKLIKL